MKAGTTAEETRRRSAEAVRQIREESRLRVARQRHRRGFSWCMLASLAGGLSLAAMDAYEARLKTEAEAAAGEETAAIERERVEPLKTVDTWDAQERHARERADVERHRREMAHVIGIDPFADM